MPMRERASNRGTKPSSGGASEVVVLAHRTSGARARYGPDLHRRQHLRTSADETVVCRYAILAIGAFSDPKAPDIEGVSAP